MLVDYLLDNCFYDYFIEYFETNELQYHSYSFFNYFFLNDNPYLKIKSHHVLLWIDHKYLQLLFSKQKKKTNKNKVNKNNINVLFSSFILSTNKLLKIQKVNMHVK